MIFNFGLLFNTSGNAAGQLTAIGQRLQNVGQAATAAGGMLTKAFTLPFIAGVGLSLAIGGKFEQEMQKVNRRLDETPNALKNLGDAAMSIGKMNGKAPLEMASALNALAFEGYNTQEMLKLLPQAISYSKSESLDMATSVEHLADMLEMFNLDIGDSKKALDILTYTASKTGQTTSELFEGFKGLKMGAKDLGWSLESVASAMLILGQSGFKGSAGGLMMFQIMKKLKSFSNSDIDILRGAGIKDEDIYKSKGHLKDLATVLDVLKSKNISDFNLNKIFGKAAIGARALIGGGSEGLAGAGVEKSAGIVDESAKKMGMGFLAQVDKMKASFQVLGVSIDNSGVLEIATKLVNKITAFVDRIDGLSEGFKKNLLIFGGITALIGPLLLLIGGVIASFLAISAGIAAVGWPVIGIIAGIVAGVMLLTTVFTRFAMNTKDTFARVFILLLGPIGWVIAWIMKRWDRLLPYFKLIAWGIGQAFEKLKPVAEEVMLFLSPILDAISATFDTILWLMDKISKWILPKELQEKFGFIVRSTKIQTVYEVNNPKPENSMINIHLTGVPAGMSANSMDTNTYVMGAQ
jgi:TP901 family phage tail tape measure protein